MFEEPVFQPGDSGEVEEIGGFVHEEEVGLFEEDFGEGGAVAPAAGELVDGFVAARVVEGELGEGGVDQVLVGPAALVLHLFEEMGLAFQECFLLFGGGGLFLEGFGDLIEFDFHGADVGEDVFEDLLDGLVGVEFGELREIADFDAIGEFDGAFGGLIAAEHEVEEGSFTGAVLADEADAFAGGDAEEDVLEDEASGFVVFFGDVLEADEGHAAPWAEEGKTMGVSA